MTYHKERVMEMMERCVRDINNLELARWLYKAKVERVIDGDTLDVDVDLGFGIRFKTRIRLAGINAPEKWTLEGEEAKNEVEEILEENDYEVYLRTFKGSDYVDERGKYGRWLALVLVPEGDGYIILNEELLRKDLAEPYDPSNILEKCSEELSL